MLSVVVKIWLGREDVILRLCVHELNFPFPTELWEVGEGCKVFAMHSQLDQTK